MIQYNSEERKEIMHCNSCYVLGRLATDINIYPGIGETNEAITIMKNSNNIVFYLEAISDEPRPIDKYLNPYMPTEPVYIGIDIHQAQSFLPLEYKLLTDMKQKIEFIKDKLKNKLILFRPHIVLKEKMPYPFKNVEIINIEDDSEIDFNSKFMCIPKINMDNETFEQKLLNGENIFLEDYSHYMPTPKYVLCGEYLYSNFESWYKHEDNKKMWSCRKEQDKITKIKFCLDDIEGKNKVIRGTENIIFVDIDYTSFVIDNELKAKGEVISTPIYNTPITIQGTEESNEEEIKFLKDFKQYTIENNLCYAIKDLINFHISVKTNPLTIVAGMSGTGKTQLARAYAKVLGLSEEDGTLLFLPISPSYTEPEDLLGFLNITTGKYSAGETGLVDFLIKAEDNPDKIHMVIFDEMNLSQVEHWFAPFISLLELQEEDRKLRLYSSNSICHNSDKYKNSIQIGDNIIFAGTVNLDETTKDFSDRLLDRANMVTLQKQSFMSLKEEQEENKYKTYRSKAYSYLEYSSWVKHNENISQDFTIHELKFLDELHSLIQKYDDQKGVSFRIFDKIGSYLINIPVDMDNRYNVSRQDAFDIQIKQRLMTKIKGTEKQFKNLIGTIYDDDKIPMNSELYEFFNSQEALKISHFNLTKKEICRKAKELSIYGYAN